MSGCSCRSCSTVPRIASKVCSHGVSRPRTPRSFGGLDESGQRPLREARLTFVDRRRRTKQGERTVAEVGEMVHTMGACGNEVQVDAGRGRPRRPGSRSAPTASAARAAPGPVRRRARRPSRPARPRASSARPAPALPALVSGEQQYVVIEPAGRGHHRGGELHRHRDVHAGAQRHDQREHVGPLAGERAGAGIAAGSRARGHCAGRGRACRWRSTVSRSAHRRPCWPRPRHAGRRPRS